VLLAILAMAGSQLVREQPVLRQPSFQCTPNLFHLDAGIIGCHEGLKISLWGVTFVQPALMSDARHNLLISSFRAREIRRVDNRRLSIAGAPPMICHSADQGGHRVAQCFVGGHGVFGGEDLACLLSRARLVVPVRYANEVYSLCVLGQPTIKRGR
jgi:hypothetical protein